MDISIYIKSTGQIISNRNLSSADDISHLDTDEYGYVEGTYTTLTKKWNGSSVVDYTPPYVPDTNSNAVRAERNRLLSISDWTQAIDSPLSDLKKVEWATYRQSLRDIMQSYQDTKENTIDKVIFPKEPE